MDFGKEIERLRPTMIRFASKKVTPYRLPIIVEDVVQTALVCAWEKQDTFDISTGTNGLRQWLLTILEYKCCDAVKAESLREKYKAGLADSIPDTYDVEQVALDNLEQEEERQALWEIIDQAGLTVPERRVVALRTGFDLNHEEIGRALNITEVSARQLFHRAVEKIKNQAKTAA